MLRPFWVSCAPEKRRQRQKRSAEARQLRLRRGPTVRRGRARNNRTISVMSFFGLRGINQRVCSLGRAGREQAQGGLRERLTVPLVAVNCFIQLHGNPARHGLQPAPAAVGSPSASHGRGPPVLTSARTAARMWAGSVGQALVIVARSSGGADVALCGSMLLGCAPVVPTMRPEGFVGASCAVPKSTGWSEVSSCACPTCGDNCPLVALPRPLV